MNRIEEFHMRNKVVAIILLISVLTGMAACAAKKASPSKTDEGAVKTSSTGFGGSSASLSSTAVADASSSSLSSSSGQSSSAQSSSSSSKKSGTVATDVNDTGSSKTSGSSSTPGNSSSSDSSSSSPIVTPPSQGDSQKLSASNNYFLCYKDGNYYYVSPEDGQNLYKMDSSGNVTKLCEAACSSIQIAGNWIYICAKSGDMFPGIYKIKTDGTGYTKVCDIKHITAIYIWNDWIYYYSDENSTTRGIYKCKLDGTDNQRILEDRLQYNYLSFQAQGDWLYYIGTFGVYRIHADGSGRSLVVNDDVISYQVVGDTLYYKTFFNDYSVYKIPCDNVADEWRRMPGVSVSNKKITSFRVSDGWFYYIDWSDSDDKLCKMRPDGSENTVVYQSGEDQSINKLYVGGEWIFYTLAMSHDYMKVRTDGTGNSRAEGY